MLTGTVAKAINQSSGAVESVTVSRSGTEERLSADVVLMATGAQMRTSVVPAQLLSADGSVHVNPFLQSTDPDVYVGGDIATVLSVYTEAAQRIEHWSVAQDMGRVAALNMVGVGRPFTHVPFFWSNMFANVQFVGSSHGSDSYYTEKTTDEDVNKTAQATFFFKGERTVAVALINRYGAAPRLRFAVERGLMPAKSEVVKEGVKLADVLKRVEETGKCCGGRACRA